MRCIFELIFFCSSSKTKISSRGISKGGFPYVFPLEFQNPNGRFQNPWNPPLATPLHFDILAKGVTDFHCKIKETLFFQEVEPAFNVNVAIEMLMLHEFTLAFV